MLAQVAKQGSDKWVATQASQIVYRRLGVKTERSGDPHRETKPSAHATTRTTRHDRSMGVIHFVSRANFNEMFPDVGHCVKRQKGHSSCLVTLMYCFSTKSWGRSVLNSRTNPKSTLSVQPNRGHGISTCDLCMISNEKHDSVNIVTNIMHFRQ